MEGTKELDELGEDDDGDSGDDNDDAEGAGEDDDAEITGEDDGGSKIPYCGIRRTSPVALTVVTVTQ